MVTIILEKLWKFVIIKKEKGADYEKIRKSGGGRNLGSSHAFTLAEVLITLGIIGVVAALTLPSFIYNHRKQVVESRLKKFYTTFNQAIILSENDNGEITTWEDLDLSTLTGAEEWFNRYLAKYLNTISVVRNKYDYIVWAKFSDGSAFGMRFSAPDIVTSFDVYFYPYAKDIDLCVNNSGDQAKCTGTKYFTFHFSKSGLTPYGGFSNNRQALLNACGNENTGYRNFCTALIIHDGWKINKDYPLRF